MAQVVKKKFLKDIQENLFAGAGFIKEATSHDMWVENDTVYIPQAGTLPDVQENRSTLPGTIKQRTDTTNSYSLNEYTTDPILLRSLEKLQLSYDKRQSLIKNHMDKLNDRLALQAMYQWAGSTLATTSGGQLILTSDSSNADAKALPPGASNDRNALSLDDIGRAAAKLDEDDVSMDGRYLIIPSKVYWNHLVANNQSILSKDYNPTSQEDITMGVVKKIYGFNIVLRSYTAVYADAATPTLKAVGAATTADDCFACIGFQKDQVARAMGRIDFFEQKNAPEYYGDIISALVMFNATKLRSDGKGIVTIVQDK